MSAPQVAPESLIVSMQQEVQQYLQSVMQAVNNAPDGEWLEGSEEQVRNLSSEFRRQVFERALQLRVDQAEAAFPPSAEPGHRKTACE
jgi:hypothetical protein